MNLKGLLLLLGAAVGLSRSDAQELNVSQRPNESIEKPPTVPAVNNLGVEVTNSVVLTNNKNEFLPKNNLRTVTSGKLNTQDVKSGLKSFNEAIKNPRNLEIMQEKCRNALGILDRSGSQQALFEQTRTGLENTINEFFTLSETLPIVGIYSFSVYAQTNVAPTSNLAQLQQGIDSVQYSGGGTKQYLALQLVKNQIMANMALTDPGMVIPLIGDLQDDDPTRLMALVNDIKNLAPGKIQFLPLVVDAGYGVNSVLATQIAGNPANVKYYPTPLHLIQDATNVAASLCGVAPPLSTSTPSRMPTKSPTTKPTMTPTTAATFAPSSASTAATFVPSSAPTAATFAPSSAPTSNVTQGVPPSDVPQEIPIAIVASSLFALALCCRKKTKEQDVEAETPPERVDVEAPAPVVANPIFANEARHLVTRDSATRVDQIGRTQTVIPGWDSSLPSSQIHGGIFMTGGLLVHKKAPDQISPLPGTGEFIHSEVEEKAEEAMLPNTSAAKTKPATKKVPEVFIGPFSFVVAGLDLVGLEDTKTRKYLANTDIEVLQRSKRAAAAVVTKVKELTGKDKPKGPGGRRRGSSM